MNNNFVYMRRGSPWTPMGNVREVRGSMGRGEFEEIEHYQKNYPSYEYRAEMGMYLQEEMYPGGQNTENYSNPRRMAQNPAGNMLRSTASYPGEDFTGKMPPLHFNREEFPSLGQIEHPGKKAQQNTVGPSPPPMHLGAKTMSPVEGLYQQDPSPDVYYQGYTQQIARYQQQVGNNPQYPYAQQQFLNNRPLIQALPIPKPPIKIPEIHTAAFPGRRSPPPTDIHDLPTSNPPAPNFIIAPGPTSTPQPTGIGTHMMDVYKGKGETEERKNHSLTSVIQSKLKKCNSGESALDLYQIGLYKFTDPDDKLLGRFQSPFEGFEHSKVDLLKIPKCFHNPNYSKQYNIANFTTETLIYMFYTFPLDIRQRKAANELIKRKWRFDKTKNRWVIQMEDLESQEDSIISKEMEEKFYWVEFEVEEWKMRGCSKVIEGELYGESGENSGENGPSIVD